ncbi:MAG: DUF2066 domain-containing protein [Woeseiaceae bacterium]|nr:DUF2066 domain-containing protein [Woeseiaceae bacterium]
MKFRLLALACAIFVSPAVAVELPQLFTAQVPYDESEEDARATAYEVALAEVLLRVSGTELVGDAELYEALFPDPAVFVVQFRPGPDDTLFVSFDGEALEEALRRSGQTYWGPDRPLTLVWLAVDWGQGEREIIGATDAEPDPDDARSIDRNRLLRERILDFAERRGLPVVFPLLDSQDMTAVAFSDVWGGFDEAVIAASERYAVDSVLIGRVRTTGFERNRWTYYFGPEQRIWTGEPELVVTQIADLLAGEFAIRGDAPIRMVDLNVSGITSVEAYGSVQSLLGDIAMIDSYSIAEVAGDRVRFRVQAVGGAERLARALRFAGLLEEERLDMDGFDFGEPLSSLDFYYSP